MAGSKSSKALEALGRQCEKDLFRTSARRPTEIEFDHELHLWLKSKKSRKTHLNTRVEAAQSDREMARGMDVINTGLLAGIILPDVIMPDTAQNNDFSLSNNLYGSR